MRKPGISVHSTDSFGEAKSVRILASVLESKQTIKTFFSENDKTPNYDGFFELVTPDGSPVKQFIVQIKKVEGLQSNQTGCNKGKYVFHKMKTNFLEYVKNGANANPAIYFVVDIKTDTIFWLYLSDAVLNNMKFEGREVISYAFGKDDILTDIDVFTQKLVHIAEKNEFSNRLSRVNHDRQLVSKDGTRKKTKPIDEVPAEWCEEACTALKKMIECINEKTKWATDTYTPIPVEWEWRDKKRKKKEENLLSAIEKNQDKAAVYLLLGAPGSGKSVSLRKLTLEMLDQFHKTKRLPLYFNLGEWDNASLAEELNEKAFYDSLIAHIKQYVHDNLSGDTALQNALDISEHEIFDYLLRRKGFFFIFDSFDEMPCLMGSQDANKTRQIADTLSRWFRKFLENGNGGIIASRKEDIWPTSALKPTVTLEVLEFDNEKIGDLIRKYFHKEPEKGEEVIKKLFVEQSDLVPALRKPLYLSLFINFASFCMLDHEETEPYRLPIKLSDLLDHFFRTALEQYLNENISEESLSSDVLLERAKDLAYQMQQPPNRSSLISIENLPARVPQDYWTKAIDIFKKAKLCRGLKSQEAVAFSHRRFQEFFYVSYMMGHFEHPFQDYKQSILGYTSDRDALILYCEVADQEAAEEIAIFCWEQIQERKDAIKCIWNNKETAELAYTLIFLSEAFRFRKDTLKAFLPEFEQFVCDALSQKNDYVIACALVGCVSLLGDNAFRKVVQLSFESKRSLLINVVLRSIRLSRQMDNEVGAMLVSHLSGRSPNTKWNQRRMLRFSFSLSPEFTPLKAYDLCIRLRDISAILCAVLVIAFGVFGLQHYNPEKDRISNTSIEEKLGIKHDISIEDLFSETSEPETSLEEDLSELVVTLKTGFPLEEMASFLVIPHVVMPLVILFWLFLDHLLQVWKEAVRNPTSGKKSALDLTRCLFLYTSRSDTFYRNIVLVPLFAFIWPSIIVLICREMRPYLLIFLPVSVLIYSAFLAAEIAAHRCVVTRTIREKKAEARKQFIRSLRNPSDRKKLLKELSSLIQALLYVLIGMSIVFLACALIAAVFIGLGYLFDKALQLLGVTLPFFKNAASAETAGAAESVVTEGNKGFWDYACWCSIPLLVVGFSLGQVKSIKKTIRKKMRLNKIPRADIANDLKKLYFDSYRRLYVRKLEEALEEAREYEKERARNEAREENKVGLSGVWPGGARPKFKSDELNAALAKLDCDDERLRSIIP